jgi:type IV pilus assembly protein PilV
MESIKTGCRQDGSTLIEILVAMIVVGLGLLGHANLIAQSAKANQTAYLRSQVTLLTYDITERLRLNRKLATQGSFNINYDTPVPEDSAEIQHVELRDWLASVAEALPAGDGKITVDGTGNVTVEIRWEEVLNRDANGGLSPTMFTTQSVI